MDDIANSLGYILDDLGIENAHISSTSLKVEPASPEVLRTACLILDRLRFHFPGIKHLNSDSTTLNEVYDNMKCLSPMFGAGRLEGEMGKYRLLHFLCTQLQAARLAAHNSEGELRNAAAGEKGKVVFQLDKICKDIRALPEEENPSEVDMIIAIRGKLAQVLNDTPNDLLSNPPKAISDKITLDKEQKVLLEKISDSYHADFLLRRQMLIKRLDVTIQSFLWGEQAQGREGEIVAAIQAQRKYLSPEPTRYNYADALEAPLSLLHEHSKRVTDQSGKSLVKTVIIGTVPDRGGRANEMRPKARDLGPSNRVGGEHKGKGAPGKGGGKKKHGKK